MPSAPQSPLTGLTVMPQQAAGQQQDSQAAQAAAAQAAAQYQVYEPQLQFAQSKHDFEGWLDFARSSISPDTPGEIGSARLYKGGKYIYVFVAPTPPGSEGLASMPAYGNQYQVVCVPNPTGGYTQVQISSGPHHPSAGLNANPCAPQKEG